MSATTRRRSATRDETRRRREPEHDCNGKQQQEVAVDVRGIGFRKAEIDHLPDGDRQHKRRARRDHQRDHASASVPRCAQNRHRLVSGLIRLRAGSRGVTVEW
jgi:hypothetical protein